MKVFRLFLFFSVISISGFAQRDYNWVFGDSVGLNFSQGFPTVLFQPVLCSQLVSASISDVNGGLLFYIGTPDVQGPGYWKLNIWNRFHELMPNGDSIKGMSGLNQSVLILPFSIDSDYYYIFTVAYQQGSVWMQPYYSLIDIKLDGGKGDVIVKDMPLNLINDTVIVRLHAVKHGNGRDWWIMYHLIGSNIFSRYLLTPTGINGPFIQQIGTSIPYTNSIPLLSKAIYGQMKFSNSGNKLCLVGNAWLIDIFDFDRCTGLLSNFIQLGDSNGVTGIGLHYGDYYGCSFSPNDSVLYVSNSDTLFQYDLYAPNIAASRQVIFTSSCTDTCYLGQHQIAPNGHIYIANYGGVAWGGPFFNWANMSISYIETPNALGVACGFNYLGQPLGGRRSFFGLPNMVNYNLGPLTGSPCDTLLSVAANANESSLISISPNPATETITLQHPIIKTTGLATVYNVLGEAVQQHTLPPGTTRQQLSIAPLPAGLYFIKVETDGKSGVKRFVRIAYR